MPYSCISRNFQNVLNSSSHMILENSGIPESLFERMTYKWSLIDKKEHFYHELQSIATKLTNMKCNCETTKDCSFCESRTISLQYMKNCLDQIDVTPLYKMQSERFFHHLSSYGYPEYKFQDFQSLRKRLSYFIDQMTECSVYHPSVISNDVFEKFNLASHKFLNYDYSTKALLTDNSDQTSL